MDEIRLDVKGKRPHFFQDPGVDVLLTALLETMSENSALRERMTALEIALCDRGLLDEGSVESVIVPAETAAKLAQQQQEFFQDAFRALNADFQSRAERQERIDDGTALEEQ